MTLADIKPLNLAAFILFIVAKFLAIAGVMVGFSPQHHEIGLVILIAAGIVLFGSIGCSALQIYKEYRENQLKNEVDHLVILHRQLTQQVALLQEQRDSLHSNT